MEQGMIITAIATGITGIVGIGISLVTVGSKKKIILSDDLMKSRDELYELSRVSEKARMDLEDSNSMNLTSYRMVRSEVIRLQDCIKDIKEMQRKFTLDELTNVREQLHALSIDNKLAKKELTISYNSRVSTEETAQKEITRLKQIVREVTDFNRKRLLDELAGLRDQLCSLAFTSDRAKSELEDSYDKDLVSEEHIAKEVLKIKSAVRDIQEHDRKALSEQLSECRDRLYELSIKSDKAKLELDLSYSRRTITRESTILEIEKINSTILEVKEDIRKELLNDLGDVREILYNKSKDNEYARRELEDSYNKNISDDVAIKEIDKLNNTNERIKREEQFMKERRKMKLL